MKECIGRHSQVKVNVQGKVSTLVGSQPASTDDPDFLVILPEKPVHIGDDWFDDYQVRVQVKKELSQRVTLRRRYTLTAVNNDVAVIRMETAEVTPVNDPTDPGRNGPTDAERDHSHGPGPGGTDLARPPLQSNRSGSPGAGQQHRRMSNTRETLR